MKKRKSSISLTGVLSFFALIAAVIQIAVLVYDYIIQRTDNNALIAVLIFIVIILLSAICTTIDYFRRKITVERPVEKILDATERIAKGDFSVQLTPSHSLGKYNEYDFIMENLNIMAAELQKSEILKTDFISNVSHEIKTPLSIIQSYASLLASEGLDANEKQRCLKALSQASRRLSELVSNILKMNKLENQKIKPEISVFSLNDQLAEIIISYEELIESKELLLDCQLDEIEISSCPSYLEIVWNNLISNAIKFTEQGGKISVNLTRQNKNVIVSVSDTGCGIDSETGAHIFDKFYQGDTSHKSQGNGLGLALVKRVIDVLGGTIAVQSELGKGSTFTIVLKDAIYTRENNQEKTELEKNNERQ